MRNNELLLEARGISKTFGTAAALKETSVSFDSEGIYGIIGRNGAGKTTLLNVLMSRIFPDSGVVLLAGKDISSYPGHASGLCCYMPEGEVFPERFRIRDFLSLGGSVWREFSHEYADRLCRLLSLDPLKRYGALSRGHRSIFRIILGLASRAEITVFDEPVLGLDAAARDIFYSELIDEFSANPRLFIVSTHYIEESADLFNEAVIIEQGSVIRKAPVEDILAGVVYVTGSTDKVRDFIKGSQVLHFRTLHDTATAVIETGGINMQQVPGIRISPMTVRKLFIHLTSGRDNEEIQ